MKTSTLFLAFLLSCTCLGLLSAQAPATPSGKRITITRTNSDADGKTVTEAWIAEGENPEALLKTIVTDPGVITQVEVSEPDQGDERLFLFRRAGENNKSVEIRLGDQSQPVTYMHAGDNSQEGFRFHSAPGKEHVIIYRGRGEGEKRNCAALGVYTMSHPGQETGARVTGLIQGGGAVTAGLERGDVIRKIDEFDVQDYSSLRFALSHYRPGDEVKVSYTRGEDHYTTIPVVLTAWKELPGYEKVSTINCDLPAEEVQAVAPAQEIQPLAPRTMESLELSDIRIFPNPTADRVEVSFTCEPQPVTVVVTDVNGKVVYSDRAENGAGRYDGIIDLGRHAPGNYLLTITQGDRVFTRQVARQ